MTVYWLIFCIHMKNALALQGLILDRLLLTGLTNSWIANTPLQAHLWYTNQPIESTLWPSLSSNSDVPYQYFPCHKSTRARYQTSRDHLCNPELTNIIQTIQSEIYSMYYPASPIPSCKTPNKGSGPCSPFPDRPWCFPVWPSVACPASRLSGSVSINFLAW